MGSFEGGVSFDSGGGSFDSGGGSFDGSFDGGSVSFDGGAVISSSSNGGSSRSGVPNGASRERGNIGNINVRTPDRSSASKGKDKDSEPMSPFSREAKSGYAEFLRGYMASGQQPRAEQWLNLSEQARDLIISMLQYNPRHR